MIDRDLAELYGVETKVINQAVKRNIERFPEEFRFQLTEEELAEIRRLLLLHIDHCDKKFSEQDKKINQIIQVLNNLIEEPESKRKIGFVNDFAQAD